MKLFTGLVVVAFVNSSVALSDFTTSITSSLHLEEESILKTLDSVYPKVTENMENVYGYELIHSAETMPPEVVDHITKYRQNYAPWYTAIQANIDVGRAQAKCSIETAIVTFKPVIDLIEFGHGKMVNAFNARGCNTYPTYEEEYNTKLTSIMTTVTMALKSYSVLVQGSIPQFLLHPLSAVIHSAISPYGSKSIPSLTLIQQGEEAMMQQTTDLYAEAVKDTTEYTQEYFSSTMSENLARVESILADMVAGAAITTCQ